ncbi:MAG: tetratricopeptide (TPR) repeat protein [Planctomycetota bacterium]|jgi:tetratricopeptide (TPR) repeat protein
MATRTNFAELLQLEAQNFESLRFLGEAAYLWFYRREERKAATIFEGLTELALNDPVGLCELHMTAGRYREAERAAQKATRVSSIDAATMAYAYSQQGQALLRARKIPQAEKVLMEALEVDPESNVGKTARELIDGLCRVRESAQTDADAVSGSDTSGTGSSGANEQQPPAGGTPTETT